MLKESLVKRQTHYKRRPKQLKSSKDNRNKRLAQINCLFVSKEKGVKEVSKKKSSFYSRSSATSKGHR